MVPEVHRGRLISSLKPVIPAQPVLTLQWQRTVSRRNLDDTTNPAFSGAMINSWRNHGDLSKFRTDLAARLKQRRAGCGNCPISGNSHGQASNQALGNGKGLVSGRQSVRAWLRLSGPQSGPRGWPGDGATGAPRAALTGARRRRPVRISASGVASSSSFPLHDRTSAALG